MTFRAFTLFCEHCRTDSNGGFDTLVGVFPSVLTLPALPDGQSLFTPIFTYTSIQMATEISVPQELRIETKVDGKIVVTSAIDKKMLIEEFERIRSKELNLPYALIVSRMGIPMFEISRHTSMVEVVVVCDGEEAKSGELHFRQLTVT